ncbi:MAG TPA: ion channel [Syntrophales bacterium]|nr:ion channel [Syntrophales bacterium]
MNIPLFIAGLLLIIIVLGDAFETMVLPRRVTRRIRLARLFVRFSWKLWLMIARLIPRRRSAETFLGFFGPLSALMLIILWATGLVFGFALMLWASGSTLMMHTGIVGFGTYLYLSGTSLFTLGMGDVTPTTSLGRGLIATESGLGLGFLALVISYLPLLNQSFARREMTISLLDSHAGSPPSAMELIRRHIHDGEVDELRQHLHEWERWSAELLESHLSYPLLALFRSHHDNQSWLGSLTTILDTCAFTLAGIEDVCKDQAKFTFAMTRHAIVDIAGIFNRPPTHPEKDRLPKADLEYLCSTLSEAGLKLDEAAALEKALTELRSMYEPYVYSLSQYLQITVPPWISRTERPDNWQTSRWDKAGIGRKKLLREIWDDHF